MKLIIKSKQKGATLLELIIVIVIVSIVTAAGVWFFHLAYALYTSQQSVLEADWQGRLATQMIKTDIELIRSTSDITTATQTALSFVDEYGNTISYQLSGSQLLRNSQVLADSVQSIVFRYYNQSGTELSSPITVSAVRYIVAEITINQTTTFSFVTGAALWNVM